MRIDAFFATLLDGASHHDHVLPTNGGYGVLGRPHHGKY
jgi:hypothetical protein